MLIKILLAIFIAVLVVKISINLVNLILDFTSKGSILKAIKNLGDKVEELSLKDEGSFYYYKLKIPSNNVKLICFTTSQNIARDLNLIWKYDDIKSNYYLDNFKSDSQIKELAKDGQKNVFIIFKDNIYYSFLIKGIYTDMNNKNPLCFKNGENIILEKNKGLVMIKKS